MDLQDELERRRIVQSEEGEMMMYAAMASIFRIGFTHESNESLDITVELHSDDSDAFAGMGMQAIYNLESTCMLRSKRFCGSVYLRCSRKSVNQISKLGSIFETSTNLDIDPQLCPTGRGFECTLDLISVYYTLEQDKTLPQFPPGHRAMSAVAVIFTLINTDYLGVAAYGLTYSKMIAAMKSVSYKDELNRYDTAEVMSPINISRQAVYMDQNHNDGKGFNLPGIILLIHHAFIIRPLTKKILLTKYQQADLSNNLPYNVVRATAILAGELQPLPDPIALLAHLSCANLIFRRWTIHLYDKKKRTDDELEGTRYVESIVKGRTVMSIDYDLSDLARG